MWHTHSCVPRRDFSRRLPDSCTQRGVETSLDTARGSACATSLRMTVNYESAGTRDWDPVAFVKRLQFKRGHTIRNASRAQTIMGQNSSAGFQRSSEEPSQPLKQVRK